MQTMKGGYEVSLIGSNERCLDALRRVFTETSVSCYLIRLAGEGDEDPSSVLVNYLCHV